MGKYVLVAAARAYQLVVAPFLGGHCRFFPSCSEYFIAAVERYGARRGFRLGVKRLLRCHPFHAGGFDPLEERPL